MVVTVIISDSLRYDVTDASCYGLWLSWPLLLWVWWGKNVDWCGTV